MTYPVATVQPAATRTAGVAIARQIDPRGSSAYRLLVAMAEQLANGLRNDDDADMGDHVVELAGIPAPRDPIADSLDQLDLEDALGQLPPEQRLAIIYVDVEGYSTAEAADALGVPVGTVKSRCARGRARLLPLLTHLRPENAGDSKEPAPGRNRAQGTSVPPAAGPQKAGPPDTGPSDSAAVKGGGGRA